MWTQRVARPVWVLSSSLLLLLLCCVAFLHVAAVADSASDPRCRSQVAYFAQRKANKCDSYNRCWECAADPDCGWCKGGGCASPTRCLSLEEQSTFNLCHVHDDEWQPEYGDCDDYCVSEDNCDSCLYEKHENHCGYCAGGEGCHRGTAEGPELWKQGCTDWRWLPDNTTDTALACQPHVRCDTILQCSFCLESYDTQYNPCGWCNDSSIAVNSVGGGGVCRSQSDGCPNAASEHHLSGSSPNFQCPREQQDDGDSSDWDPYATDQGPPLVAIPIVVFVLIGIGVGGYAIWRHYRASTGANADVDAFHDGVVAGDDDVAVGMGLLHAGADVYDGNDTLVVVEDDDDDVLHRGTTPGD